MATKRGPKPMLAKAAAGIPGRFDPPVKLFNRRAAGVRPPCGGGAAPRHVDPHRPPGRGRPGADDVPSARLYDEKPPDIKQVVALQNCVRGLRRELRSRSSRRGWYCGPRRAKTPSRGATGWIS